MSGSVDRPAERTWASRLLAPIADVRANEVASVLLMTLVMFLILAAYYMLKTAREVFILSEGGAEVKSYSSAGQALLPNLVPTLLVLATLEAASLMLAEATLSFLGLGLPLAEPSWGQMLATGRPYITNAWWLITFPGLAILFTVLSLNLIGVWARRVMDPVGR